jgi:hypothetical protein
MFSIIEEKRTCSPRSSLLCASRKPSDLDMLFPARPNTPHSYFTSIPALSLVSLKGG